MEWGRDRGRGRRRHHSPPTEIRVAVDPEELGSVSRGVVRSCPMSVKPVAQARPSRARGSPAAGQGSASPALLC